MGTDNFSDEHLAKIDKAAREILRGPVCGFCLRDEDDPIHTFNHAYVPMPSGLRGEAVEAEKEGEGD